MADYANELAMARVMIAEAGCAATLVCTGAEVVSDPTKPWAVAQGTDVEQTVSVVLLAYEARYVDGTTVHAGDRRALLAAAGLTTPPNINGEVVVGSDRWRIISMETLSPSNVPILYTLQVRQ